MKISTKIEIVLFMFLLFMGIYTTIGNPSSKVWSGLYFITLHSTLLVFFSELKHKYLKAFGLALQISILIFVICKFFLGIQYERVLSLIPLSIIILLIIKTNKK